MSALGSSSGGSSGGRDRLHKPHLDQVQAYTPGKPIEELERELGITQRGQARFEREPARTVAEGDRRRTRGARQRAPLRRHARAFALRARLRALHGVQPGELAFGNGSNELIDLICRVFAGPWDHAVIGTPSFVCYRLCLRVADVPVTEVPLDQGLFWNVDRLLQAVRPNTKLLFLDNPNNPTSTHLGRARAGAVCCARCRRTCPGRRRSVRALRRRRRLHERARAARAATPNLIVLRTFSKVFGLAALRVGYAVGPTALLDYLPRVGVPFNLNGVAQAAALAALDDSEHVRAASSQSRERARLSAALTRPRARVSRPARPTFCASGVAARSASRSTRRCCGAA